MQPGDIVAGRYEVVGRLASGGMAEVYVADLLGARGVRRRVALKRIHPHLAEDSSFARMFLDEAKLASELRHPSLVPVLDAAEDGGELVLVLDYVAGWDLGSVLRRARETNHQLPEGVVVGIGEGLASALAYVHELRDADGGLRGIVHRDVTPSNVLIAEDGSVRLLDFGVAKAAERSAHTVTATLKGKLGYMAPEQASAAPVDARTDLYALGLVLFEMLSGFRALSAEGDIALLELARRPIHRPTLEARPSVSRTLARLVDELRAADPADRPKSTRIVAASLAEMRSTTLASDGAAIRGFVESVMGSGARPIQAATRARVVGRSRFDEALALAAGLSDRDSGTAAELEPTATQVAPVTRKERTSELLVARVTPEHGHSEKQVALESRSRASGAARWTWVVAALMLVGALGASGWMVSDALVSSRVAPPVAPADAIRESPAEANVGFVRVLTNPAGATVRIDDRVVGDPTPTVLQLAPGNHRLVLAREDHASATADVEVRRGASVTIEVPLSRLRAKLIVRSRPSGASVELGGRHVGTTPLELSDLPRSDVVVRVSAAGHAPLTETVRFGSIVEHVIDSDLSRRAAYGMLDVSSSPWARVTVGGRTLADSTPALGLRLPVGRHVVVLSNPTIGWSETRTVTIRESERTSLVVRRAAPARPP